VKKAKCKTVFEKIDRGSRKKSANFFLMFILLLLENFAIFVRDVTTLWDEL